MERKIMIYSIYFILFVSSSFGQFNWQNDGSPIRQGVHIEWQRTGDANSDGSMIYAWSDCRNGVRDVIAQKVDINGDNLWGENGVVAVNADGRQEDPQLVTDGAGGAFIIWMDYRDETDAEGDIYAQHVLSDGSLAWDPEGVALVNQTGQQSSPNICSDGQKGAFVIWKDNTTSSYGDIYATHLASGGIISGGQGVPIITFSSYRSNPSLNTGGSGEAVLVWSDDRNTDEDLYVQRISVSGNTINTEWGSGGKLISGASGDQTSPRVAQYNGDNTIVTWEDNRGENTNAYYQILDKDGIGQLTANGVPACSGNWEIIKPRVKAENSVAYIVWEDRRHGWTSDIYAQKIDTDGSILWGDGMAITISDGSQTQHRLATDGSGGVYFVWEDERNSSVSEKDIYAQHVSSSGTITHDINGQLICDADNVQFNPLVRSDGSGGALIVWGDQRTGGSYGIYLQHLTNSGINFVEDGKESFFGIATDAASESYNHGAVYLENDETLVYWQDNRWGASKVYGTIISSSFYNGGGDYFSNSFINGQQLSSLDLVQEIPKAILTGDKIFLSFKVEESPNENLYFQLLNLDLSPNGNATAISNPSTSKQDFDMISGDDGYIYYAYSEDYDISIKKINANGVEQWSISAVSNLADDILQAVYPYPGSGCIIIYYTESFIEGTHIYAMAINEDGDVENGWPVMISDLSGDQYYDSSVLTQDGIIVSFTDNTSEYDVVYIQHILFNGTLAFGSYGKVIVSEEVIAIGAIGAGDQGQSALAYNQEQNVFICYEYPGTGTDIGCNMINLSTQIVEDPILITGDINNDQQNPFVEWSGTSFLITWIDFRNSTDQEQDIYFQEYKYNEIVLSDDEQILCTFAKKQENPIIAKYSDDSYVILWEDYRSTGKALCANLYGQSFTVNDCNVGLVKDECGVCGGPGETDDCGCADIPDGYCDCDGNVLDECSVCGGDGSQCVGILFANLIPEEFYIHQNYPNPFNPSTTIRFDVPEQDHVQILIYDITGRKVAELINDIYMPGSYQLVWNAGKAPYNQLSSGVYLYSFQSIKYKETKKFILLK